MTAPELSRRDRNMRDKRDRIFRAASELFASRGFEAVTTQEVSDRADVGSGTLFRYAATKSDLLLMAYNEEFHVALHEGERRAARATEATIAVNALIEPSMRLAQRRTDNSVVYQRELMFGSSSDRFRTEGLVLVAQLEASIARSISNAAERTGVTIDTAALRTASSSVFANMHLAIARLHFGPHEAERVFEELHQQIAQIITGTLTMATLDTSESRPAAGTDQPPVKTKKEQ